MLFNLKIAIVLCVYFAISFSEQCLNTMFPFEQYLATKTPYRVVANKSFDKIQYEGCKPIKLWMLVRHGTRNPSADLIQSMKDRLPEIRDQIVDNLEHSTDQIHNRDLELFKKWKTDVKTKDEKKLVKEGEEEMLLLGERMQSRFPDVLDSIYSNTSYKFKFTASQRTKKSAYYFAGGLFGKQTSKDVWFPEPLKKDPILRFYKLCNKWRNEIKGSPQTKKELDAFDKGPVVTKMISEINKRLGFKNELSLDDIYLMYMTCSYETAWNIRQYKSPWCSAFTTDHFKIMEYREDLHFYWNDGYGHELTYKQACPAFYDMLNTFRSNVTNPKSTIYFTHSGTLSKMLAHMGLYHDTKPLTAASFEEKVDNRQWRTGRIDTFANNLAFVLFDCKKQMKVLTLHQENIIRLPSCPDSDLCDLSTIDEYYNSNGRDSCQFNTICNNNDGNVE